VLVDVTLCCSFFLTSDIALFLLESLSIYLSHTAMDHTKREKERENGI